MRCEMRLLDVEQQWNQCPALTSGRIASAPEGIPFQFFMHLESEGCSYNVFSLFFIFFPVVVVFCTFATKYSRNCLKFPRQ